jgi:hypothetical protein
MAVRTMQLGTILAPPRPDTVQFDPAGVTDIIPATYDFDDTHPGIQMSEFLNDQCGDCVIAARANHTLRLSYGPEMMISDAEVLAAYHREAQRNWRYLFMRYGGIETQQALDNWQNMGWTAAGKTNRKILGHQKVDWTVADAMRAAIYSKCGVQLAFNLPKGLSATDQCGPGHPWNRIDLPIEGGHTLLLCGYTQTGAVGVTWGVKQDISWEFINHYGTAAYVVTAGPTT